MRAPSSLCVSHPEESLPEQSLPSSRSVPPCFGEPSSGRGESQLQKMLSGKVCLSQNGYVNEACTRNRLKKDCINLEPAFSSVGTIPAWKHRNSAVPVKTSLPCSPRPDVVEEPWIHSIVALSLTHLGVAHCEFSRCRARSDLGDLYTESGQTFEGSFSAVSKPIFATKYSLESSRRDLHDALLCTALPPFFFQKFSKFYQNFFAKNLSNFANFCQFFAIF